MLSGCALARLRGAHAVVEVAFTGEDAVEPGRVRELYRAPPGFIDLDDRPGAVQNRNLVMDGVEHRRMQSLGAHAPGFRAAER